MNEVTTLIMGNNPIVIIEQPITQMITNQICDIIMKGIQKGGLDHRFMEIITGNMNGII